MDQHETAPDRSDAKAEVATAWTELSMLKMEADGWAGRKKPGLGGREVVMAEPCEDVGGKEGPCRRLPVVSNDLRRRP